MEKELQGGKATPQEICRQALEHYEKISKECCNWSSTIPAALKIYEQYLDLKGEWPEERDLTLKPIPLDREERVKLLDERSKAMIWNEALHLCKLACLKERMKERKIGKKEIVQVIDSALGYEGIGARMTSEEIDKVTTAILKLLNKE